MTERHRLRSVLTLAYLNGVIPIRTMPLYLIGLVSSPLSFLFFIVIASHLTLFDYAVSGGLVLTMLSIGTGLQTDISHYKQDLKFQDLLVASPVEAPTYVIGMAFSELVYSVPALVIFAALLVVGGSGTTWLGAIVLLGVLLLVWAFASALGFTLATYFEDVRETFAVSPLVSVLLSVLPPVFYPITYLPAALRPFAYLSPTTYAADLAHGAVGLPGPSLVGAAIDWGVLIATTVILVLLATAKARWRDP